MTYTKESLADHLNGREYPFELTGQELKDATVAGFVVVCGASDDLCEFTGAMNEEAYGPGDIYLTKNGPLEHHDDCDCKFCGFKDARKMASKITAIWGADGYSWTYKTDIPHADFDVLEEGEKYCRAFVFAVGDLKS